MRAFWRDVKTHIHFSWHSRDSGPREAVRMEGSELVTDRPVSTSWVMVFLIRKLFVGITVVQGNPTFNLPAVGSTPRSRSLPSSAGSQLLNRAVQPAVGVR